MLNVYIVTKLDGVVCQIVENTINYFKYIKKRWNIWFDIYEWIYLVEEQNLMTDDKNRKRMILISKILNNINIINLVDNNDHPLVQKKLFELFQKLGNFKC